MVWKIVRVRFERRLRADLLGRSHTLHRSRRNAPFVLLLIDVPVARDLHFAPLRQEVDDRHADAVQTAGGLVGTFLELAAELQHGHHAFERRHLAAQLFRQLLVRFDRDPATIIFDRHRAIGVDGHLDVLGEAGHRFVDGIVDDFVDEVVQPARGDVADVHRRTFPHMFHVGKMLQILRRIIAVGLRRLDGSCLPVACSVHMLLGLFTRLIVTHGILDQPCLSVIS